MLSKKLENIVIELVHGDITKTNADIIVNAANNALWMGSGVAGAIKAAGGPEIEREAMAKGPVDIGAAVETGAGKLKARYIIHAAVMGQNLDTSADRIALAEWNSFALAEKLQAGSIAFPALGTGVGGFSIPLCARIMLEMTKKMDGAGPRYIKRVIFVLYTQRAYDEFEKVYREL
jgi:O-acetyl-ADP-ribose deacetylase (regulator of RNase III)